MTKRERERERDVLQAHPLLVKASIGGAGSKPVQLQFFYLPQLEVVTVKANEPEHQAALASLFSEDTGASLPNETPSQLASSGGFDYDSSRPDRPYLYAPPLSCRRTGKQCQNCMAVNGNANLTASQQPLSSSEFGN